MIKSTILALHWPCIQIERCLPNVQKSVIWCESCWKYVKVGWIRMQWELTVSTVTSSRSRKMSCFQLTLTCANISVKSLALMPWFRLIWAAMTFGGIYSMPQIGTEKTEDFSLLIELFLCRTFLLFFCDLQRNKNPVSFELSSAFSENPKVKDWKTYIFYFSAPKYSKNFTSMPKKIFYG